MIIYKITNTITNKIYIGQTHQTLENRMGGHETKTRTNRSNSHLHNSMRKHGKGNFTIEKIDEASSSEELDLLEEFYIREYDSVENGYNLLHTVKANPMYQEEIAKRHGEKMRSEEVRNSISQTMKKHREEVGFSEETRRKISIGIKKAFSEGRMPPSIMRPEDQAKAWEANKKKVRMEHLDGTVMEFNQVKEGAHWWIENYNLTIQPRSAMHVMKKSNDTGNSFYDTKWTYL